MNIAYAEPVFMAVLHSTVFLQLLFGLIDSVPCVL